MDVLQNFFQAVGSLLAPKHNTVPVFDEDVEAQTTFISEQDAVRILIHSYSALVEEHYGRPIQYTTDLFCNMIRMKRVWWIPVNHPLAVVIRNHFEESGFDGDGSKGSIGEKTIGECVVYDHEIVTHFVSEIVGLFESESSPLKEVSTVLSPPTTQIKKDD